jgi:hypothetical protein
MIRIPTHRGEKSRITNGATREERRRKKEERKKGRHPFMNTSHIRYFGVTESRHMNWLGVTV